MGAPGGRGRVAARIALALLVVLGCAALSGAAAGSATGPVPYVSLHLDGSSATFSVPSWSLSSSGCQFGEPGTSQSFDAALSAGSGGFGVLGLSFSGGSLSSSVSSPGPKEIQLDLTGSSNNGAGSYELKLTGYGTSFTGTATLSDPTCTYSSSSASLSLAGHRAHDHRREGRRHARPGQGERVHVVLHVGARQGDRHGRGHR